MANVNFFSNKLQGLVNDPRSIAQDPGYQFEFDQGQQAVSRGMRGMRGSGNALAALAKFGQGLASTRRGEEIDRMGRLMGQEQQYDLGQRAATTAEGRLSLDGELGRGQLSLGRDRLGLDRELGQGQLALGRDRMGLDRELGMGQLDLGRSRLGFERESDMRRDATTRRGQDFEFDLGGRRLGNERDLGLGRIGADLQQGWWNYDLGRERNALTGAGQENDFNLARERLGVDRYDARTRRNTANTNNWYTGQRNRREELPFRDPWSRF